MNYRLNFASIFSNKVKVPDFTNKNITDIIKWSEKNGIGIDQVYEYSEIIKENKVITQDNYDYVDKNKIVTISVSDGVDPSNEIIIPDMTSWSVERVVKYIKENHLSNIVVDFNESDRKENTLISQSKVGTVKRDDEILLAFSLGEKYEEHEIKLRNLKNMDKIDAIVYLKQNQLDYELKEDFSNKVKKGKIAKQDITPGSSVKKEDKVVITVSKGKEIVVPNLKDMNIKEISNWAIKNKLRIEFTYKHDESIKKNKVISSNFNYKDKVKEKETLKIVLSSGKLKMPKFKNLDEFYAWANK
ncbi:MAG: PASTA domain-containing protein [Romboutsia sp.]|nr:PASTA domain-containing protein [Romboutsia sp.]